MKKTIKKQLKLNWTTMQIYRKDLKILTKICNKDESLKDKLHEIISGLKK